MKKFMGIPGSPGMVLGKALLYRAEDPLEIPHYPIQKNQVDSEWERFLAAREEAAREIQGLYRLMLQGTNKAQAPILETHLMMLEDLEFQDQIKEQLKNSLQNIEWVVWEMCSALRDKLLASPVPFFQERALDISDISQRLMHKLLSFKKVSLGDLPLEVIVVSHDLLPSDLLGMQKKRIQGILIEAGSRTSHTAILARAFGIPLVLGLPSITKEIRDGETLAINGDSGEVILNPEGPALAEYQKSAAQGHNQGETLRELPAETRDGRRVSLMANMGTPEEVPQALLYGAEGVGLYRSEFLFLTPGQLPDEERQYQAYQQVLRDMGNLPVTIRTLDIGGDKLLPELQPGDESNPLLGWRAIRFSLSRPEFFKTQLRAILRAGAEGSLRILLPMISGIEELEQALALVEEAKAECRLKGQAYGEPIEVGTMIEVPAAAMTADILADRTDFFSIGTNDLIQYTLAADRGNERVSYLAQASHPAVLRLLKRIIDSAHEKGIKAALCGELAGDPTATALLLGLGLDEFSMTPQSIPRIKGIIRGVDMESCRVLAETALQCISVQQVTLLVETWMSAHFPAVKDRVEQYGL